MDERTERVLRFRRGQLVTLVQTAVGGLNWSVRVRIVWGVMLVPLECLSIGSSGLPDLGTMAIQFVSWLRGDAEAPGWLPKGFQVEIRPTV